MQGLRGIEGWALQVHIVVRRTHQNPDRTRDAESDAIGTRSECMDKDQLLLLTTILAVVSSVTSICLALVTGYDRAKSVYWDWVARRLSPLEYSWAAGQFSPTTRSGTNTLPPNATLDGGPDASDHGIFGPAIGNLRARKWYRGRLIRWRRVSSPDAVGNRPWLCVLHPEIHQRTRPDGSGRTVYR
jgi:hypothetical protein